MDLLKKNWLSVVFAVVVIVAIVALFFPIGGQYRAIQDRLTADAGNFQTLNTLRTTAYIKPQLDPNAEEGQPLQGFPTASRIQAGQEAVQRQVREAETILNVALQRNEKRPLVDRALPNPNQQARFQFRAAYVAAYNLDGRSPDRTITRRVLNGTTPPGPETLQAEAESLRNRIESEGLRYEAGQPTNAEEVAARVSEALAELPRALRSGAASEHAVYVNEGVFAPHEGIQPGTGAPPDEVTIFNAQTLHWTYEEVAGAVARVNQGSSSVASSPIKHVVLLMGTGTGGYGRGYGGGFAGGSVNGSAGVGATSTFTFVQNAGQVGTPGGDEGGLPSGPLAVDASATLTPNYQVSPTGRPDHTPMYDAVRFPLVIRVDARRIPEVLAGLQRDRLLTIENVSMTAIDGSQAAAEGFLYGDAPVVELTLDVELLFLRTWLSRYVPPVVAQQIAAAEASAAAAGVPME